MCSGFHVFFKRLSFINKCVIYSLSRLRLCIRNTTRSPLFSRASLVEYDVYDNRTIKKKNYVLLGNHGNIRQLNFEGLHWRLTGWSLVRQRATCVLQGRTSRVPPGPRGIGRTLWKHHIQYSAGSGDTLRPGEDSDLGAGSGAGKHPTGSPWEDTHTHELGTREHKVVRR